MVTVGASGVGKTALMRRYFDQVFDEAVPSTIGVDFRSETIMSSGVRFRMQVWDTAGQEKYRSLTKSFFRGAQGAIFVFDVTNPLSLEEVKLWVADTKSLGLDLSCVIVANKIDLIQGNEQTLQKARSVAKEFQMKFVLASAKTGQGVVDVFKELSLLLIRSRETNRISDFFAPKPSNNAVAESSQSIKLEDLEEPPETEKKRSKSTCCF